MTHSSQLPSAEDGMKNLEENPEKTQAAPDIDEDAEPLNRHDGSVTTDFGGESVSDLVSKV